MSSRSLFAAVVTTMTLASTLVGADGPLVKLKLKHDDRLITADILATEDGKHVFVNGRQWRTDGKWQLNVVRTSDWNTAGPMTNAVRDCMKSSRLGSIPRLFHDPKACELVVPQKRTQEGIMSTSGDVLAAFQPGAHFARLTKSPQTDGDLDPTWDVTYRRAGETRHLELPDAKDFALKAVLGSSSTEDTLRIDGGDRESVSSLSISPTGKYAFIGLEDQEIARPLELSKLEMRWSKKSSGFVCVNLDDRKAVAAINLPGRAAVTAATAFEDTQTAVCGRDDGTVCFLDLKKGAQVGDALPLTTNTIRRLSISPDRKHLVVLSLKQTNNLSLVDLTTRKSLPLGDLGGGSHVCAATFSPKGDRLYTLNTNGEFFAWDFVKLVAPKPGK